MHRLGRIIVSCALAALLAGCDKLPDVFEDVGNDPHPPSLTLLGIGLQPPAPEPPPEPPAGADEAGSPPVTYYPPSVVLTVRPYDPDANTLSLKVSYADAAGDIDAVVLSDQEGSISGTLTLPEFLGTAGTFEAPVPVAKTSMAGLHQLQIWAQDANGSRSARTSFAVFVEL